MHSTPCLPSRWPRASGPAVAVALLATVASATPGLGTEPTSAIVDGPRADAEGPLASILVSADGPSLWLGDARVLGVGADTLEALDPQSCAAHSLDARGWAPLFVVEVATLDPLPDAASRTFLVRVADDGDPELLTTWVGSDALSARDLDGDGRDELVVDRPLGDVCGLRTLPRTPRVWDGERFRTVGIRPSVRAAIPVDGVPGELSTEPGAQATRASSGLGVDLSDGLANTTWRPDGPGGGVGEWVAFERIPDAPLTRVDLRTTGATRLLVHAGAAEFVLDVPGAGDFRFATPTEAVGCVAVQLAAAGAGSIAELRVVTTADSLPAQRRVDDLFIPAVERACLAAEPLRACGLAEDAISALESAGAFELSTSSFAPPDTPLASLAAAVEARADDATPPAQCVVSCWTDAVGRHDADGVARVALAAEATNPAAASRWVANLGDAALPRLASALAARTEAPANDALVAKAEALVDRGPSPQSAVAVLALAASGEPRLRALAIAAAPYARCDGASSAPCAARVGELVRLGVSAPSIAARVDALRVAAAAPKTDLDSDADAALAAALADDDGSVARLAIANIGRHDRRALLGALAALVAEDPAPALRAQAVDALAVLGAEGEAAEWRERAAVDESPTVRLACANAEGAAAWVADDPARLCRLVGAEPWPEVRAAWLSAAVEVGDPAVDDAAISCASSVEDALAVWETFVRREGAIPAEAVPLATRFGAASPVTRWLLAGATRVAGGCPVDAVSAAADALAGGPDEARAAAARDACVASPQQTP